MSSNSGNAQDAWNGQDAQASAALAQSVRNGDEAAFEALYVAYLPLIESTIRTYIRAGSDLSLTGDDYRQEAALALYLAAVTYHSDRRVTFGLYAKVCIRNRMISFSRKARQESVSTSELLPDTEADDPALSYVGKESAERLFGHLTALEGAVLRLYLGGLSTAEIAGRLSKNEKSVYNTMARIRTKLRRTAF